MEILAPAGLLLRYWHFHSQVRISVVIKERHNLQKVDVNVEFKQSETCKLIGTRVMIYRIVDCEVEIWVTIPKYILFKVQGC